MNQFGRVAAYLSSPYWCMYSAQCRVRLSLCTVHCTYTINSLTLHSAVYTHTNSLTLHCALNTPLTVSLCTVHCTHTINSLTLHCALYTHN